METAPPGVISPLASRTRPLTVADVAVCARAGNAERQIHRIASKTAGDPTFDRISNTSGRPAGLPDPGSIGREECYARGGGDSGRAVRRTAARGAMRGATPRSKAFTTAVAIGIAPSAPARATSDASLPVHRPRILQVRSPSFV